jgi:hypothetical protein
MKEAIDYVASAWNNVSQTTIQNCWVKTGILPSYDEVDVDDDIIQDFEDDDEIEDLLNELPENDEIRDYFQVLDHQIPTEEHLNEEQIINMIRADNEEMEGYENDDEEEIVSIPIQKAVNGLETFINFFEQQNDVAFDFNDLRIFRKYVRVVRVKEINLRKQGTLDLFLNDCGI